MEHFVQAGETTAALEVNDYCGGKGLNQSIALSKAGCSVWHAGMIGPDGGALLAVLQENRVDTTFVKSVNEPTGHAIIQVDRTGQNCIIIYGGANACIDEKFIDSVYAHLQPDDIVLMQNETSCMDYAIRRAHQLRLRVALNPSPITQELVCSKELSNVTWFILNETEGRHLSGESDAKAICMRLKEKYPQSSIMLTLGQEGCLYYDGKAFIQQGIYRVKTVDTTAAGDTFTGYFLAGICRGEPVAQVLQMASKASAMAVAAKGAAPSIPLREQVETVELQLA